MLAIKGYEQSNGFSVMDADELFFISGGSSTNKLSVDDDPKIPGGVSGPTQKGSDFILTV